MKVFSRRIGGLLLCLVIAAPLLAAPGARVAPLFARWMAYIQSKLAPPRPATQDSKISPPLPGVPSSGTDLTTSKVAPRQP